MLAPNCIKYVAIGLTLLAGVAMADQHSVGSGGNVRPLAPDTPPAEHGVIDNHAEDENPGVSAEDSNSVEFLSSGLQELNGADAAKDPGEVP